MVSPESVKIIENVFRNPEPIRGAAISRIYDAHVCIYM